jgi:hypothetical protein
LPSEIGQDAAICNLSGERERCRDTARQKASRVARVLPHVTRSLSETC